MSRSIQPLVVVPIDLAPTLEGLYCSCDICSRRCWRDLEAEATALGLARMADADLVRICDLCHRAGELERLASR